MAVSKVILNGNTLIDTTQKTVTASKMLSGETALNNAGEDITGNIATKTSSNMTVSGATVTAPAGYYASNASKSVASGSATPAATISATGASVSTGTNTLTLSKSVSNTPTVTSGYVSSGTAGNSSVSLTASVTTQAAQTIHPSTSDQTIASGRYLTGTQTVKAVKLTNLSASNIVSGITVKVGDSTDDDCVTSVTGTASSGESTTIEALNVTVNGTYTAPSGKAYSPVTVNVSGGGGDPTGVKEKQITFYDYDGRAVYSYTADEFASLTALPDNPSHEGLTATGWNWTLSEIQNQLANVGGTIDVGQTYKTSDGKTRIYINIPNAFSKTCTMRIGKASSGAGAAALIDWGDGTSVTTINGVGTPSHTYANCGSYIITIDVQSGEFYLYGYDGQPYESFFSESNSENRFYVYRIEFGENLRVGDLAFYYLQSLQTIIMPNDLSYYQSLPSFDASALSQIIIPRGLATGGLQSVNLRDAIGVRVVSYPGNLTGGFGLTIQTTYNTHLYFLRRITIPSGCSGLLSSTFREQRGLTSVYLPSSITNIPTQAFNNCDNLREIHFRSTTPPSLTSTNSFTGIASSCTFYVPYSADHSVLEAYQTATNWSTYASKMQEEPQ